MVEEERREPGLDELWEALRSGLSPDAEQLLLRLLRAHARFLAELVFTAQEMAE